MRHQLFFGNFVRLHILRHAAEEPVSCMEIMNRLRRHGYPFKPARIRAMLQALCRLGCLSTCIVDDLRGRRKCYRITAAGRNVIAAASDKLQQLAAELLQDGDEYFQDWTR